MKFRLIIFFILFNSHILGADWIITTSGTYTLNDDLLSTNADSNGSIRIQSSFVTLDLNGRFVMQNNSTANANGIVIDSNLTDIVIKNGAIVNFTRAGVTVNSGCSVISLQNLKIENCQQLAMEFLGTQNNEITRLEINESKIFGCGTSTASTNLIKFQFCRSLYFNSSIIGQSTMPNTGTGANGIRILRLQNCTDCNLSNIKIQNILFSGGVGASKSMVTVENSSDCLLKKFFIRSIGLSAGSATLYGSTFIGTASRNIIFSDWLITTMSSNLSVIGFSSKSDADATANATNVVYEDCKVLGLQSSGNAAYSFFYDTSSGGSMFLFKKCMALNGRGAANNDAVGMTPSMNSTQILSCFSAHNFASGVGNAIGFRSDSVSDSLYFDCDALNNTVSGSDATSRGFLLSSSSNVVYSKNIGLLNGSTANTSNQISGVAGGSVTSATSATIATPTAPWTNLSIAS